MLSIGDNRAFHGTGSGTPDAAMPLFARRILVSGAQVGAHVAALAQRPHVSLYAISDDSPDADPGLVRADATLPTDTEPLPFPPHFFDAALLQYTYEAVDDITTLLEQYSPLIAGSGVLVTALQGPDPDELEAILLRHGWCIHQVWPREETGLPHVVVRAHRTGADLRAQARQLYESGHAAWAYDLLYLPPRFPPDEAEAAGVALDALRYLQAMGNPDDWPPRLSRLARAHWLFSAAASFYPDAAEAYAAMATILMESGLEVLGSDLMRSCQHRLAQEAPPLPRPAPPEPPTAPADTPRILAPDFPVRSVLLLTRQQMDYGLDTLYDGLCAVLGDQQVVEYPWKPTLHGDGAAFPGYYPATFSRAGAPQSLEAIHAELASGAFDLILFGDLGHDIPRDAVRYLLSANPSIPVAVVDQGDSPEDDFLPLCAYLDREEVAVYFKREKMAGIPYHPRVHPLPFSYPDGRIPELLPPTRNTPVYWAGNRHVWMRRLYLESIERRFQLSLGAIGAQGHYREQLLDTRISPSFFGGGFDTVRYWEIPAHGSLLLSERPPIAIPHNFEEGRQAVYFSCAAELEEALAYYLNHPDEAEAIALAGHAHLRTHHTASARARQLLACASAAIPR